MNRLWDYAGFIGWFAGLGYIVLWPITGSAHPLELPPGLHVLGLLSALFVTTRLLVHAIKRTWRAAGKSIKLDVTIAAAPATRAPPPARRAVKPRTHFGLRGMPR
jgi:hypothetical protein